MAAGHNNGFNPFRDASGRFSGKGRMNPTASAAAAAGSGAMNDALRSASGRATGPTGGARAAGPGGGGGGGASKPAATAAHVTPALLATIDKQTPTGNGGALHPATHANLNDIMQTSDWRTGMHASYDGVNGVAFSMLSEGRGQMPKGHVDTLITAYKEAGFDPPAHATNADLLAFTNSFEGVPFGGAAEANRTSYGIAYALKAGNQGVALNFADGRQGAGIGWDLTRQELGADLEAENIAKFGTA